MRPTRGPVPPAPLEHDWLGLAVHGGTVLGREACKAFAAASAAGAVADMHLGIAGRRETA